MGRPARLISLVGDARPAGQARESGKNKMTTQPKPEVKHTPRTDLIRDEVMAGKWSLTDGGGLLEKLELLEIELAATARQRDELLAALRTICHGTMPIDGGETPLEDAQRFAAKAIASAERTAQ